VLTLTAVPFPNWAAQAGLSGPDAGPGADPDGDGLPNLLEYALGGSPNSTAASPRPTIEVSGDHLAIAFVRARSDVTYLVEGSSDLIDWSPISFTPVALGQTQIVSDTVPISTANPARRFLRLRVTLP